MARVRSAAAAALLAVAAVLVLRVWRGHAPGLGGSVSEPTDSYGAARPRSAPRTPADGAAWLDDDAAAHAAWRPRWQWPDPRSTLPAVVDVVQWSARPEWRRSLFRRAHPALIQGSPAGQWPALERWRHPGQGEHHVCSVVDTLPNVMTPSEHASPANTFFYLNPNAPMAHVRYASYRGHQFYHAANTTCEDFFHTMDRGDTVYYSNGVAATSLKLLDDIYPLTSQADEGGASRINVWMASAGATARMHFDSSHNIFVQVVGHKRMLLVSPEQWDELHMYPRLHPASRQSQLDLGQEGAPALAVRTVVLGPGDALFIPAGYFHHVEALDASMSVNMYYTPAWHELLPRIFASWPVLPSYRGTLPQDIDPCVIRDLAEFVTTVVQLGVIRMSSVDEQALRRGVRAFVSTVASTRYNKLGSDPTFANGEVFITEDLEVDLQHACSLVGVPQQEARVAQMCGGASHDGVAALEVGRIVAVWLRRVPPGMRGLLAADYLEQAVYRVLGARHVAAFFATCLAPA